MRDIWTERPSAPLSPSLSIHPRPPCALPGRRLSRHRPAAAAKRCSADTGNRSCATATASAALARAAAASGQLADARRVGLVERKGAKLRKEPRATGREEAGGGGGIGGGAQGGGAA